MPTKREWTLLALALPVILAAAGADRGVGENAAIVAEVARSVKSRADVSRSADVANLKLPQLRREETAAAAGNAFESKSWYVAPPPPPPALPSPPPVPTAPPLPFSYLGRYEDAGKPIIFLSRGDRVLSVTAGEVIEGTYRVDGISGSTLAMTYLPLNVRQTLDIGNAG